MALVLLEGLGICLRWIYKAVFYGVDFADHPLHHAAHFLSLPPVLGHHDLLQLFPSPNAPDALPAYHEAAQPREQICRSHAEASTKKWQCLLIFTQDPIPRIPRNTTGPDPKWVAFLSIETRDLPGLMTAGLHIRPENVILTDNHFEWSYSPRFRAWAYARRYRLEGPGWAGNLMVASSKLQSVIGFRIDHLMPEQVFLAHAEEARDKVVYVYEKFRKSWRANAIYHEMPLEGLWPWPKRDSTSE